MQLVGDTNPLRCKVRSALLEHREDGGTVLTGDDHGVAVQRRHARRSRGVNHIRLAATTCESSRTRAVAVLGTSRST